MREIRLYGSEGRGGGGGTLPAPISDHGFLIFVSSLLRTFTVFDMMSK